jgi:IMP dehydrogenase
MIDLNQLPTGLTFDDILLLPNYSEVRSQDFDLTAPVTPKISIPLPYLTAPMDTVTEAKMAIAVANLGALGILHRNLTISGQANQVNQVKTAKVNGQKPALDKKGHLLVGAAVGVRDTLERTKALLKAGTDVIVIDTAHGHSKVVLDQLKAVKNKLPQTQVIAGNITTGTAAEALIKAGADGLRVGMGPGAICTTRINSGMGVPQITAIASVTKVAKRYKTPLIGDGGIRYPGDVTKALAAGAHTTMIGNIFAGTDEAPSKIITKKGKKYKVYRGMGSYAAMKKGLASDRYADEKKISKRISEGVVALVPVKGPVKDTIGQLTGGLKAGLRYVGAKNIKELQQKAKFIQITSASLSESHPHSLSEITSYV